MISYLTANQLSLPDIHTAPDLHACGSLAIIDTSSEPGLDRLDASHRTHIAYATSPAMLTWKPDYLQQFLEEMDMFCVASEYLQNQLSICVNHESTLLPFPVSEKINQPKKTKKKQIVAIADSIEDNLEGIKAVFDALPDFNCIILPHDSANCQQILAESWGYINMSRSSKYPVHFIQAGLASCFIFVWSYHRFADKYPVHRFEDDQDGPLKIEEVFEASQGALNTDIRKDMIRRHGLPQFKKNLTKIIESLIFQNK